MRIRLKDDDKVIDVEEVKPESEPADKSGSDKGAASAGKSTSDDALTPDEVAALKKLAASADALLALLPATKDDEDDEDDEDEDAKGESDLDAPDSTDDDSDVTEVKSISEPSPAGTSLETPAEKKVGDSFKHVGALRKHTTDSSEVNEDAIDAAWSKRYNGGK